MTVSVVWPTEVAGSMSDGKNERPSSRAFNYDHRWPRQLFPQQAQQMQYHPRRDVAAFAEPRIKQEREDRTEMHYAYSMLPPPPPLRESHLARKSSIDFILEDRGVVRAPPPAQSEFPSARPTGSLPYPFSRPSDANASRYVSREQLFTVREAHDRRRPSPRHESGLARPSRYYEEDRQRPAYLSRSTPWSHNDQDSFLRIKSTSPPQLPPSHLPLRRLPSLMERHSLSSLSDASPRSTGYASETVVATPPMGYAQHDLSRSSPSPNLRNEQPSPPQPYASMGSIVHPEPRERVDSLNSERGATDHVQAPTKKKKKRKPRICTTPGCDKLVVDRGVCIRHGGGKRCNVEGCNCRAQNRGLCWKHGGYTICKVEGCAKRAKSRGICWSHGGGTQCKTEGCEKIAVSRGRCWAHGGGKRCKLPECQKPAALRTNDYCTEHHAQLCLNTAHVTANRLPRVSAGSHSEQSSRDGEFYDSETYQEENGSQ